MEQEIYEYFKCQGNYYDSLLDIRYIIDNYF